MASSSVAVTKKLVPSRRTAADASHAPLNVNDWFGDIDPPHMQVRPDSEARMYTEENDRGVKLEHRCEPDPCRCTVRLARLSFRCSRVLCPWSFVPSPSLVPRPRSTTDQARTDARKGVRTDTN